MEESEMEAMTPPLAHEEEDSCDDAITVGVGRHQVIKEISMRAGLSV